MAEWKHIQINDNLIKAESDKSYKIAFPHSSDCDGYSFWITKKLVKKGFVPCTVSIGYTDDFTFKIKRYGKGRFNQFEVIDEMEISAEEFETAFGCVDDNIVEKLNPYETHKPQELEAEQTEALDELKDE